MNSITIVVPDWFMYFMLAWMALSLIETVLSIVLFLLRWWIGKMLTDKKTSTKSMAGVFKK